MREVALVGGVILLVGLIMAAMFRDPVPSGRIRMAGVATPVSVILRWGIAQGLFATEGLEVEFREQGVPGDLEQVWGGVDVVVTDVEGVIRLQDRSPRPVRMAQVLAVSQGAHVLLAREGITEVTGLKGRRIGVAAGAAGEWLLQRALDDAGLVRADVTVMSLAPDQVMTVISTRQVDAVVVASPVAQECNRAGAVNRLYDSAQLPGDLAEVMLVDQGFLTNRPKTLEALRRAWTTTARAWLTRGTSAKRETSQKHDVSSRSADWLDSSGFRLVPGEKQRADVQNQRLRMSLEAIQRLVHGAGRIGFGRFDACLDGADEGGVR